jgi:hypothetical protein
MDSLDDMPEELVETAAKAVGSGLEYKWLNEVLKDVESKNPTTRSKALEMLGKYLGCLHGKGSKPGSRMKVDFSD